MACAIICIASACCEPKGRCHQMSSLWPGFEIIPLAPELPQRILRELFAFDYNTSTRCGVCPGDGTNQFLEWHGSVGRPTALHGTSLLPSKHCLCRADPFFNLRPLWYGEWYMVRMIIRRCGRLNDPCGISELLVCFKLALNKVPSPRRRDVPSPRRSVWPFPWRQSFASWRCDLRT
eukprot:s953_g24.t2